MNAIELIIFCIGIFTVAMFLGALAAAFGSRLGKKLSERKEE